MRNNKKLPKIKRIISVVENLPFFSLNSLASIEENKTYLKILFSRYAKKGELIRLKKGLYTTKEYLETTQKNNTFSIYLEFIANILYKPSYLSLDYILYQFNLLTELPTNFISVTQNKTTHFTNNLGDFFYHKVKDELFCGFEINKEGDFTLLKATKSKALFDFLYLRKNLLVNKRAVEELRLNLDNFQKSDLKEVKKYFKIEGSEKMREIFNWLFV